MKENAKPVFKPGLIKLFLSVCSFLFTSLQIHKQFPEQYLTKPGKNFPTFQYQ